MVSGPVERGLGRVCNIFGIAQRTPYQICAVLQRQKPRRQLAGAHHGREDDFATIIDAIFGNRDARRVWRSHGFCDRAERGSYHNMPW